MTSWRCPFCDHHATIGHSDTHESGSWFKVDNVDGPHRASYEFIVCPNPKCKKFTFTVELNRANRSPGPIPLRQGSIVKSWQLIPPSKAKVFPGYVPKAIREDYEEACLIRDLSPKGSATLARRCLQGMIRDFWRVAKKTLKQEIDAIKDRVEPTTWKAIETVRRVGNIGAHMEQDINLIIDVEPKEAKLLIGLIELLFRDWYITRHEREERFEAIVELGEYKEKAKKGKSTKAKPGK